MFRIAMSLLAALALTAALASVARGEAPGDVPAPPAADVAISPGDVITITVIGEPTLSHNVTVTADGKVPLAFIGELKVSGMKPTEAAAAIRTALSRYLRDPQVTVDLLAANRASIYGKVLKPGTYVLPPQARALDLVQMAGGFDEQADRANVRLLRKGLTITVDLAKFAVTGDANFNPELQAGDMLNVPERPALNIPVLGQVMHPGNVVMPTDATAMDAVQMAGGFSERADREHVLVMRGGTQLRCNFTKLAGNTPGPDNPVLQAGDSVTVPEKRMLSITVLGQVTKPSVYQLPEGATVAEAVQMAGGLVEGADPALARLIRRDQTQEPLNLKDALENANAAANVKLMDGDTISIPKPAVERRFGVLGSVRAGGYFPMDRDTVTVTEALSRAGGPLPEADLRRAIIVHHNGDQVTRTVVDLRSVLKGGKAAQKGGEPAVGPDVPTMGPGDVLYLENKKPGLLGNGPLLGLLGLIPALIYAVKGL